MEDIRLIYPAYEEIICINYFNRSIINKNKKGKFVINSNILKIKWNNKTNEENIFIKNENIDNINFNDGLDNISTFIFIKDNINSFNEIKDQYELLYSNETSETSLNKTGVICYYSASDSNQSTSEQILQELIIPKFCVINNSNGIINVILINNKVIDYISLNELGEYKINDKLLITWNSLIEEIYIKNISNNQYYIFEEFEINGVISSYLTSTTLNNFDQSSPEKILQGLVDQESNIFDEIIQSSIIPNSDKATSEQFIENFSEIEENNNFIDEKCNFQIFVNHINWNGLCTINKRSEYFYRNDDINEYGKFIIENDILIVYWDKWDREEFRRYNNSDYDQLECYTFIDSSNHLSDLSNIGDNNMKIILDNCIRSTVEVNNLTNLSKNCLLEASNMKMIQETEIIYVNHINWIDNCIINFSDKKLYRESNIEDYGYYTIENNKLIINWEKWNSEIFYKIDNIYYYEKNIKFISFLNNDCTNIFNRTYSIKDDINVSILNFFTNKIYTNSKESYNFYFESTYIYIDNNNEYRKYYYVYDIDQNIIIYKNSYIKIDIVKDTNKTIVLNLLDNTFSESKHNFIESKEYGLYKIDLNNNIISLKFLNNNSTKPNSNKFSKELFESEELIEKMVSYYNYTYKDNKYYYTDYLLNREVIFIDNINNHIITYNVYKIDLFQNILFNNDVQYKYLKNNNNFCVLVNNKFIEYCYSEYLNNNNKIPIYIAKNIYDKIKNLNFNYKIYTELNNDITNSWKTCSDLLFENELELQVYINWLNYGINNNRIYSIDSFLFKNHFFNIERYMKNNNFKNEIESIIHWNKYGIFSNYFYSDIGIEIVYDNFEENYEDDDNYIYLDNSDEYNSKSYLFSDNNFNTIYKFEDVNNYSESLLYIINIDCYNSTNIEEILESIPKKINCIININFCENIDTIYNFHEILNKSFNNVILIKSKNIFKYYLLEFINKNIFNIKNISHENIIYIDLKKNKFTNICKSSSEQVFQDCDNIRWNIIDYESDILSNLRLLKNNNIILINNSKIYKNYKKNNLFYYLLDLIKKIKSKENVIYYINNVEIIKILVFYCIIRKKVFELGEKDFIITYNLFIDIMNNDFTKNINFLV